MTSPMIEPDELAALHAAGAVQVVDCRFRLGEHGAGRVLHAAGRIPGALYLDLDDDLSAPMRADRLGGRHPCRIVGGGDLALQRQPAAAVHLGHRRPTASCRVGHLL